MRIFPIAVIGIMLAACTTSTGVIPAGPNTYALTVRVSPIAGGSMAAQPKALASAQAYCQTQGREMMLTSSEVVTNAKPRRRRNTVLHSAVCCRPTPSFIANLDPFAPGESLEKGPLPCQ